MNGTEWTQVNAGTHWLNKLADELGKDAMTEIRALDAQDWTPGEIAIAIIEAAQPMETTMGSKVHITCFPFEKSRMLKAAKGEQLNEWARRVLIEAAMKDRLEASGNRECQPGNGERMKAN